MSFISLEEFLALPDSDYEPDRPYHLHLTGRDWITLYNQAKESFEKYGEEGPPIGTEVLTLRGGFGSRGPLVRRTFKGIYADNPRFFILFDEKSQDHNTFLSEIKHWWRDFFVPEEGISYRRLFRDF